MTDILFPRRSGTMTVSAAAAALLAGTFAFGMAAPASASELRGAASKFRTLEDQRRSDVTIIIIDENGNRTTTTSPAPGTVQPSAAVPLAPKSKVRQDQDEVRVYIKRKTDGTRVVTKPAGPKVIIVDGNSDGCDGAGVCVIRP